MIQYLIAAGIGALVGSAQRKGKKFAMGGTTGDKPRVESVTEVFMLMDGTEIDYEDMDDAKKMFGGDPLSPQDLVDKLAVDHDIYVMDAAPELFDLPDGDDEDDDEFYTGEVKDGVTIDDIEDAIEDELQGDNSYNYSAPFVFDVRFTKTDDTYDPQIMLVREHLGGDVRGNYGEYQAFSIDADTNPFYGKMSVEIQTDKGRISLDAESLEGYNFYVSRDETGTFEEDSTIDRDEIAEAFDFGSVKSETLYINDFAHGGVVGDKLSPAEMQKLILDKTGELLDPDTQKFADVAGAMGYAYALFGGYWTKSFAHGGRVLTAEEWASIKPFNKHTSRDGQRYIAKLDEEKGTKLVPVIVMDKEGRKMAQGGEVVSYESDGMAELGGSRYGEIRLSKDALKKAEVIYYPSIDLVAFKTKNSEVHAVVDEDEDNDYLNFIVVNGKRKYLIDMERDGEIDKIIEGMPKRFMHGGNVSSEQKMRHKHVGKVAERSIKKMDSDDQLSSLREYAQHDIGQKFAERDKALKKAYEDKATFDLPTPRYYTSEFAHGGKTHRQGYDDKLDESLAMRRGAGRSKQQSRKDRRDESAAMEKSMGRRKYASVGTMDKGSRKMAHGGIAHTDSLHQEIRDFLMSQGMNPTNYAILEGDRRLTKPFEWVDFHSGKSRGGFATEADALQALKKFLQVRLLTSMAHGGMHRQGYDDKLDESLAMRRGAGRTKQQSRKDRRDESAGMERSMGRRKYASVGTMDKGRRTMEKGGKTGRETITYNVYNINGNVMRSAESIADFDKGTITLPNGKKFKVKPDLDFTMKFQKTQIKAKDGLEGLVRNMKEFSSPDSAFNLLYADKFAPKEMEKGGTTKKPRKKVSDFDKLAMKVAARYRAEGKSNKKAMEIGRGTAAKVYRQQQRKKGK
ncbi:MAG: hypothetical protein CMI29_04800 [Opitutae bacterium]|nr:hypothetical protein [Opitutae bacterium]|tara:strand:+ start:2496 stop:5213 length:2718 start_codon:yes stop_codon:yes gene_type:complete